MSSSFRIEWKGEDGNDANAAKTGPPPSQRNAAAWWDGLGGLYLGLCDMRCVREAWGWIVGLYRDLSQVLGFMFGILRLRNPAGNGDDSVPACRDIDHKLGMSLPNCMLDSSLK